MPKSSEYDFWTQTRSPEVVGGIIAGLAPLVLDPKGSVDVYVMLPEGPRFVKFPRGMFDSSAQDILWIVKIFDSGYGAWPEVQKKLMSGSVSEIGEIVGRIVDEIRLNETAWRKWYVDWASKTPWEGWSLPTVDRTKLIIRHGYVSGERFAIGITRS